MADDTEPPRPIEIDESEKYVRVRVSKKGKVTIEAFNFGGVGCRAATEKLEQRLGGVTARKEKDDGPDDMQQTVSS